MANANAIRPSRLGSCTGCDAEIGLSATSSSTPYCLPCRQSGRAPSQARHGTDRRYASGCRCEACRANKTASNRARIARRIAEGQEITYSRVKVPRVCASCDAPFLARTDKGKGLYCSLSCANDAQGRRADPRFRIAASARLALYERDGWMCQLCMLAVDPTAHYLSPRAPTLDHIQPRARGGSDFPGNLRLACRDCNNKRGTNVDWEPMPS